MEELKEYELEPEVLNKLNFALIETENGEMVVELFPSHAPIAVTNFAHLANDGFYDGLSFHRVIEGFVAQGGCPLGIGTGGPGWRIKCECVGQKVKHRKGSLSMAHAGRDTGGSQFFVCYGDLPHLDGVHTIFGAIKTDDKKSLEVLDKIKPNDEIKSIKILETLDEKQ